MYDYLNGFSNKTRSFIENCIEQGYINPYNSCIAVIKNNENHSHMVKRDKWNALNKRSDNPVREYLSQHQDVSDEIFEVCLSRYNKWLRLRKENDSFPKEMISFKEDVLSKLQEYCKNENHSFSYVIDMALRQFFSKNS